MLVSLSWAAVSVVALPLFSRGIEKAIAYFGFTLFGYGSGVL